MADDGKDLRSGEVSALIERWQAGDDGALDRLLPMVYAELKQLASAQLRSERRDHTLQTTGLVHEVYLKLLGHTPSGLENERHFFALAAKAMRQILIDHARKLAAQKRLHPHQKLSLEGLPEHWMPGTPSISSMLDIDRALEDLDGIDERAARVFELIYFIGLDQEEVAAILGVTPRTVRRLWRAARLWISDRVSLNQAS